MPVSTAERSPSIQEIAARGPLAGERPGCQHLLNASLPDDRHEQVPKAGVAPEHRAPLLHDLPQRALVVGDSFRLDPAFELERGHAVHLVDGVPVVHIEHRHRDPKLIEHVHEQRRQQRMWTCDDLQVESRVVMLGASHDRAQLSESESSRKYSSACKFE